MKRDETVDVAKGICMLSVIWVHCCYNLSSDFLWDSIRSYIQLFYMPCFFILSGYFIKNGNVIEFIKKKAKTLLWPFIFMYLFSYFIIFFLIKLIHVDLKNELDILSVFFSNPFPNAPIWFLSALFFGIINVFLISKIHGRLLQWGVAILLFFIGYYWNTLFNFRLPFFWNAGLTSVLFLKMGPVVKHICNRLGKNRKLLFGTLVLCFLFSLGFREDYSMLTNTYPQNVLIFIWEVFFSCMFILLCSKEIKNSFLSYIGRNSLIVLCFHMFIIMGLKVICKNIDAIFIIPVCFVITLLSMMLIIPVIKRYFSFVFR